MLKVLRKINKLHRDLTSHDKTVFIHIWHDFLGRKHQRIYKTQNPESLEWIRKCKKVARYTRSIYKSPLLFYYQQWAIRIWNKTKILFTIAPKHEVFDYKSSKYVQHLYVKNFKNFMKEIKEDVNKWGIRVNVYVLEDSMSLTC